MTTRELIEKLAGEINAITDRGNFDDFHATTWILVDGKERVYFRANSRSARELGWATFAADGSIVLHAEKQGRAIRARLRELGYLPPAD